MGSGQPLRHHEAEDAFDELAEAGRGALVQRIVRAAQDAHFESAHALVREGWPVVQQLIGERAKRPHIHRRPQVRVAPPYLGRHVGRAATDRLDLPPAAHEREAKVAELEVAVRRVGEEHVGRLDVSVHGAEPVHRRERVGKLPHERRRLGFIEAPAVAAALQVLEQRAAAAVFEDAVRRVPVVEHVGHVGDVRVHPLGHPLERLQLGAHRAGELRVPLQLGAQPRLDGELALLGVAQPSRTHDLREGALRDRRDGHVPKRAQLVALGLLHGRGA
eukprot:3849737-Prymnesium_polylepis.1